MHRGETEAREGQDEGPKPHREGGELRRKGWPVASRPPWVTPLLPVPIDAAEAQDGHQGQGGENQDEDQAPRGHLCGQWWWGGKLLVSGSRLRLEEHLTWWGAPQSVPDTLP